MVSENSTEVNSISMHRIVGAQWRKSSQCIALIVLNVFM
jgi:hypothetical protein